jgi:hypothetical protein
VLALLLVLAQVLALELELELALMFALPLALVLVLVSVPLLQLPLLRTHNIHRPARLFRVPGLLIQSYLLTKLQMPSLVRRRKCRKRRGTWTEQHLQ